MNAFQAMMIEQEIRKMQGEPCMLCHKKSDGAGVFFPVKEVRQKLGIKHGHFVYSLCSKCRKNDDWNERVEDTLMKQIFENKGNVQN